MQTAASDWTSWARDDERTSASSCWTHISHNLIRRCNRAHGACVVACLQLVCTYTQQAAVSCCAIVVSYHAISSRRRAASQLAGPVLNTFPLLLLVWP